MDVMEFFRKSEGTWRSQRTTHHLPFRRAESGGSEILVEALNADDARIIDICTLHNTDPALAVGGAFVKWQGTMEWDREGEENHEGTTVFALVPDADNPKHGKLLRERGYAEIVPVIGEYEMDQDNGLVLLTDYETMSSIERFWFPNPDLRFRTSVVKRFGGFSTASFCTEYRTSTPPEAQVTTPESTALPVGYSAFGW